MELALGRWRISASSPGAKPMKDLPWHTTRSTLCALMTSPREARPPFCFPRSGGVRGKSTNPSGLQGGWLQAVHVPSGAAKKGVGQQGQPIVSKGGRAQERGMSLPLGVATTMPYNGGPMHFRQASNLKQASDLPNSGLGHIRTYPIPSPLWTSCVCT